MKWETYFKKHGWKECVAVVFRRMMPYVDLDVIPPIKYIMSNENMNLNEGQRDIEKIIKLVIKQGKKKI
jgi:hypothetical protein